MKTSLPVLALFTAATLHASDWAGGSGNWSSDGSPGWNGTGVPNAVGAVANFSVLSSSTLTQNVTGGVTVGTIS